MAKTTGPLLSFDARGQVAKTQVYASWRGRGYVRRYTIPSNPKSSGQVQTRTVFTWLQQTWKLMDAAAQAPWIAASKGQPITDRNLFGRINIPALRTATSITSFVGSPGCGGMFPCTSIAAAASPPTGDINIDFAAPVLPSGWTFSNAVGLAIAAQNPQSNSQYESVTQAATTSPIAFTGLPSGQTYVIAVWAVGQKPDGTIVYSPSVTVSATSG